MGKILATVGSILPLPLFRRTPGDDSVQRRPFVVRRFAEIHISAEEVDLYARRTVSDTRRFEIEAHLVDCPVCKSKVAAAVEFSLALAQLNREVADMRAGRRIPTDDPATLQVLSAMSPDRRDVRIRDVSKGGMCIRTAKPIDKGAHVKVQRGTMISVGEVRYCIPVGDMFHAGILLREVC
jgi:hypothetical protein